MEAAVTLKGTPAQFDLLRQALRERIADLDSVLKGSASAPTRAEARTKMALYSELLGKLQ